MILLPTSAISAEIITDLSHIIECPINKDTTISSVKDEDTGNNGKSSRLKLKSIQEYILCDIDVSDLKGQLIKNATFHFRALSPLKSCYVDTMGISTIATDWVEGRSHNYKPEKGSSCFVQARYTQESWAYNGSTLMDVVFGRGHTIWDSVKCTRPDNERWQQVEFNPDLIAARIAGISNGFCLYDDVGSEWYELSGVFHYNVFPNRFVFSRESFDSGPWFELEISGRDMEPPDAVNAVRVETKGLPGGEAFLFWPTPQDHGGGKTLGFDVSWKIAYNGAKVGKSGSDHQPLERTNIAEKNMCDKDSPENRSLRSVFPRYLIPMAGQPGQEVKMHVHDIDFSRHDFGGNSSKQNPETIEISIVSIDTVGNKSKPFVKQIALSRGFGDFNIPEADVSPFSSAENISDPDKQIKISVIDLLDKYIPETEQIIPRHEEGYGQENHIFSDSGKLIRFHGAKNEDVWFQMVVRSDEEQEISFESKFRDEPEIKPVFYKFENVMVMSRDKGTMMPDPLIPVNVKSTAVNSALDSATQNIKTKGSSAYICEIFIPHDTIPGLKRGSLVVKLGNVSTKFDINLMVWNFTLPDKLSFVPEMNAYSATVSPCRGYRFYRLAHRHRTCMNWLPYGWNGLPEFAPEKTEKGFVWNEWDRYILPLVSGSAFHDLPRKNQPVDVIYLPLSENWPVSLDGNYRKSWLADEALSDNYRQELKQAFAGFAQHIADVLDTGRTRFQFYLNNKVYYRERFKQSSAPWIFDEPVNIQDFKALKWYGKLWHEAVDPLNKKGSLCFRCDISYTQFGRNILWGITDIEYLGGNNEQKNRMKQDEFNQGRRSSFAEYGTANKISDPNLQPVLWQLSAWSKGACGVLPWQTVGSENCWNEGEQTALFYPKGDDLFPSVRLKAFQYGQQFVEYLVLLAEKLDVPKAAVGRWLMSQIELNCAVNRTNPYDAGSVQFEDVSITDLWKIRYEIGSYLSDFE